MMRAKKTNGIIITVCGTDCALNAFAAAAFKFAYKTVLLFLHSQSFDEYYKTQWYLHCCGGMTGAYTEIRNAIAVRVGVYDADLIVLDFSNV